MVAGLAGTAALTATVTETYSFTSGGTGGGTPSATFTSDRGHSVTVKSGIYDDEPAERVEGVGTVQVLETGLGVLVPCGLCGDIPQLDGNGNPGSPSAAVLDTDAVTPGTQLNDGDFAEILSFRFGREVTLRSITFADFDATSAFGRTFDLVVGDHELIDRMFDLSGTFLPPTPYRDSLFAVGAWQCITGFAVASISVDYETSDVPLPAGGLLLLTGLAGLAVARRRR